MFGALYGAAARPVLGPELTIAASLVVFSGALQFALVGLLVAGAAAPALLLTAVILDLRHIVLGAVIRPLLGGSRVTRVVQAWFLLDETFGLAIATASDPDLTDAERQTVARRTLVVAGLCCYAAWIAGTLIGVLGAGVAPLEGFAAAVFPVLFIGLAALATRTRSTAARAVAAAAVTAVVCFAAPDARALAPVVASILVALPGDARREPEPRPDQARP